MVIPREMMTLENWERVNRGLAPIEKPKIVRPEPEFPKIDNRIEFESIPLDRVIRIARIRKNVLKNKEGMRFIGYDIQVEVRDSKPLQGWILEGDFVRLKPFIRGKVDQLILNSTGY